MGPKSKPASSTPSQPPSTRHVARGNSGSCPVPDELSAEENRMLALVVSQMEEKFIKYKNDISTLLQEKDQKISSLEQQVSTLRSNIITLEERLDDAESERRSDSLILSGSEVPAPSPNGENLAGVVSNLLREKVQYQLSNERIASTYRIDGKSKDRPTGGKRILVKLKSLEDKRDIIRAAKRVKPSQLYINENLTQERSRILFALRQARRKFTETVSGCESRDGKIFVYVKAPVPTNRDSKVMINSWSRLDEWCRKTLDIQATSLLDNVSRH